MVAYHGHTVGIHTCSGGASEDAGSGGGAAVTGTTGDGGGTGDSTPMPDGGTRDVTDGGEGMFGSVKLGHGLASALLELGVSMPSRIQVGWCGARTRTACSLT